MKIAANITLLFCELPLLARFMAARRAGFDGVEIQFPYSESPDALQRAAAALAGRQILIEALNPHDVPDYLIGSLEEAQVILARCTAGLQFDVYHVARMGLNPAEEFEKIMPAVRHVQFADAPGRHEPGSGQIQFETVLQTLECAGYDGWLGAEYRPAARTTDGLEWLAKWRRRRGRLG